MEFNYNFDNTGNDETVLLMHGFLLDMNSMEIIAAHLEGHFNILNVDLPGFGKTPSTGEYTMDDISDSLAALVSSLGLGPVHILGYSMGGRVAVSFMVNHPDMVLSAVLESSSPGINDLTERQKRFQMDRDRAKKISSDYVSFINEWEQLGLFSTQNSIDEKLQHSQRKNRLAQHPEGAADSLTKYGTGIQKSYWDSLTFVSTPVLLVVGEKDEKFVSINRKMKELLKNAQFEIISDTGHNIHMEAADKFGIIILEFLIGG